MRRRARVPASAVRRPQHDPRGLGSSEMNARYSRLFPVTERKSFEFLAETTNLANRLNVTGLNSTATVDAAGNITTPATLAPNGLARSAPAAVGPALQLVVTVVGSEAPAMLLPAPESASNTAGTKRLKARCFADTLRKSDLVLHVRN